MATVPHADRRPRRPARVGPVRVVAARPLLSFFVLAYALTWAWWLPLVLAGQTVTQGDGWPTHFPGLLGPALAALLVTAATHGPSGVAELLRRMGRWRIGLQGWLLAVSPLALGAIAVLVVGLAGQGWPKLAELSHYSGLPSLPRDPRRLAAGGGRQRLGGGDRLARLCPGAAPAPPQRPGGHPGGGGAVGGLARAHVRGARQL